jgi:hypothetical protein
MLLPSTLFASFSGNTNYAPSFPLLHSGLLIKKIFRVALLFLRSLMEPCSPTNKPLKILTIDGGGLQAISTLLILDKLLDAIAENNEVIYQKPRPCDVFDTIAGIGAGGWLALMLGRFHMDVTACLSEWYKIIQCITPRSKSEEMSIRLLKHCYFDKHRLIDQVDHLTRVYRTGEYLYSDRPNKSVTDDVRTRHVFVAALRSDGRGYNLFRNYPIPESVELPHQLLAGPQNPHKFKISSAFGVTGAAKYFSPPWKEKMSDGRKRGFSDTSFPKPHNITELALNEMWGLYGVKVTISVIVNIGPGHPGPSDFKRIARRFSWGRKSSPRESLYLDGAINVDLQQPPKEQTGAEKKDHFVSPSSRGVSVRFEENTSTAATTSAVGAQISRRDTVGSMKDQKFDQKMKRLETDIEKNIREKLNYVYTGTSPEASSLYFRLALPQAPPGTAQNDALASDATLGPTLNYLSRDDIANTVVEIRQRLSDELPRSQIPVV